jgi:hypothetical protein
MKKASANAKSNKSTTKTKTVPIALNVTAKSRKPLLNRSQKGTVIRHTEYLGDVSGSEDFEIQSKHAVQPAISSYSHGSPLGNWLPNIAKQYDYYQFRKLRLKYYPSCPTTTSGLLLLGFDPNPDNSPPTSFQEFRSMICSQTGPVRDVQTLDLTPFVKSKKLRTRENIVTAYPLYDVGTLYVATSQGTTSKTGYYEIEYDVELFDPQFGPKTEGVNDFLPNYSMVSYTNIDSDFQANCGYTVGSDSNASAFMQAFNFSSGDGQPMLVAGAFPASADVSASVAGCRFPYKTGKTVYGFFVKKPGVYRIFGNFNFDFTDYTTMALLPLRWTLSSDGQSLSNFSSPSTPFFRSFDTNLTANPINLSPTYARGFTNPGVGVNSDDTGIYFTWDFTVQEAHALDTGTTSRLFYTIACGVRYNTTVSENATASTTLKKSSVGTSAIYVKYLGPEIPALTNT